MASKVVYKYATGQEIPERAKYLCTVTETREFTNPNGELYRANVFVWHYYELIKGENNE